MQPEEEGSAFIAPGITAQWDVCSGAPCIAGRRLMTSWIVGTWAAGSPVAYIADEYGISQAQVEDALRYEYTRRRDRKPEFRAKKAGN